MEMKAVTETIAIITEDDAREHLAKTVTLLQVDSSEGSAMRAMRMRVAAHLRKAAQAPEFGTDDLLAAWHTRSGRKAGASAAGPRAQLSTLAVSVELDAFTK